MEVVMLRKATRDDKRVLDGLGEFIESLELDILKNNKYVRMAMFT